MRTRINGLNFRTPLLTASGTFSEEQLDFYRNRMPFGGIVLKTHTFLPRDGNDGILIKEVKGGLLNSIGLANCGIKQFKIGKFSRVANAHIILSAAIFDEKEIGAFRKTAEKYGIKALELNLSCPNIKGKDVIEDLRGIKGLLEEIKSVFREETVFAKLSYAQVKKGNIDLLAKTGFNGVTVINTVPACDIDIGKKAFVFEKKFAGLSGDLLFNMALKSVIDIKRWSGIPVIACGGVSSHIEVIKYIMAGAHLVQIGSRIFGDPGAPFKIEDGIKAYMKENGIRDLREIRGIVK